MEGWARGEHELQSGLTKSDEVNYDTSLHQ